MKIISIVGARPNFVKIAPFCRAIQEYKEAFQHLLLHTGQHFDAAMSDVFFDELSIPKPDIHLGIGGGSHAQQTAKIMLAFEEVCLVEKPDWVVVVGDVNSTLACALVAAKLGIKVAHIESGLRSFDRSMPEEINRLVVDAISDVLFTPSSDADQNLKNEGVNPAKISLVGNIMIDTLVANLDKARDVDVEKQFGFRPKQYALITLHRPSNVDQPESLAAIMSELNDISAHTPLLFPVHPRTEKMIKGMSLSSQIKLVKPTGYHESIALQMNALFIVTDSGGVQEESTYLGTPCLTLRPNTERPVTISAGTNKLTKVENLKRDVSDILSLPPNNKKNIRPPLWDGQTANRIAKYFFQNYAV